MTPGGDPVIPDWWTSDEWATPPEIVAAEVARGGPFDLDVCARPETTKAPAFYTKNDDGLVMPWRGRVWCNPPYSDPGPWVRRAALYTYEQRHATRLDLLVRDVVMLLPASTDTAWFHKWVLPYADLRFLRGRIKFLGPDGKPRGTPKAGSIMAYYPRRDRP